MTAGMRVVAAAAIAGAVGLGSLGAAGEGGAGAAPLLMPVDAAAARQGSAIRVSGAWVREPVPGRALAAAYATLENSGTTEIEIVSASADVAGSVEMHEMVRSGDMMKMAPVKTIRVPAGGRVELKPGGLHLMLFGLKRPLKDGDAVSITFALSGGATSRATAPVRRGTTP